MKDNEWETKQVAKRIEFTYSSNIVEFLKGIRATILLSTYLGARSGTGSDAGSDPCPGGYEAPRAPGPAAPMCIFVAPWPAV